jgi:hypothetical protein
MARTIKGNEQKKAARNGKIDRERLLALAKDNPYQLFNVAQIRVLFDLPEHQLRRFRKLSGREPKTDPWMNDLTRPEKFHDWLWGKRYELEIQYRDI